MPAPYPGHCPVPVRSAADQAGDPGKLNHPARHSISHGQPVSLRNAQWLADWRRRASSRRYGRL